MTQLPQNSLNKEGFLLPLSLSIGLGMVGSAITFNEFVLSSWTFSTPIIFATLIAILAFIIVPSVLIFKTNRPRLLSVVVALGFVLGIGSWISPKVRLIVFEGWNGFMAISSLQAAVADPAIEPSVCRVLAQNVPRLLQLSQRIKISDCEAEISQNGVGVQILLKKTQNVDQFCEIVSRTSKIDEFLPVFLKSAGSHQAKQSCIGKKIDESMNVDALIELVKTNGQMLADMRINTDSELLSSDDFGVALFVNGCAEQDTYLLARIGKDLECPTLAIEAGWPNICERIGADISTDKVCALAKKLTVGLAVNEARGIIQRALRRYSAQRMADSITYSSRRSILGFGGGGRGGFGGGNDSSIMEVIMGNSKLSAEFSQYRTAIDAIPADLLEEIANLQKLENDDDEFEKRQDELFELLFSRGFESDRALADIFAEANDDFPFPEGQEEKIMKDYKKFKKQRQKEKRESRSKQ